MFLRFPGPGRDDFYFLCNRPPFPGVKGAATFLRMFSPPDLPPNSEFISALTRHQTALRGFCQAALGREDDAMEALQRTNIVLWKKAANWDPQTSFLRWATAVARFEVLALIRDRQRLSQRMVFDSELVDLMAAEGEDDVETFESRQRALGLCWAELLPKHREVLAAHYASGCSMREIAESRKMGVSAVKVMMLRLRQGLASCISQKLAAEAGP